MPAGPSLKEGLIVECKKCKRSGTRISKVLFANGTEHFQENCKHCDAYIRFVPKWEIPEPVEVTISKTKNQLRREAGLPTGCFECEEKAGIDGFCKKHRKIESAKKIKGYCKKNRVSIWSLTLEQIEESGFLKEG